MYEYSANLIDCFALKCSPKQNYFGESLIIVNIYMSPAITNRALTEFFDSLIENVELLLVNDLFTLCGDFNRVNTYPLSLIGLTDLVNFRIRLEAYVTSLSLTPPNAVTSFLHPNQ